jgi:quercetin dioxygenase-like cupin family protein
VGDLFPAEQAESVSIGGVEVIFRMSGEETDGAYELFEFRLEPGRLIPPHAHDREHEVSYVLEGEIVCGWDPRSRRRPRVRSWLSARR